MIAITWFQENFHCRGVQLFFLLEGVLQNANNRPARARSLHGRFLLNGDVTCMSEDVLLLRCSHIFVRVEY